MNTQTADELYDEFRNASLAWLAAISSGEFDMLDLESLNGNPRYSEINGRMLRAGEAIKSLPHDAPGALRAKSALALFWYDCQDEIEADTRSEGWDVATRADLTHAAARVMCPGYLEALTAARSAAA